jgi:hypothetical protein
MAVASVRSGSARDGVDLRALPNTCGMARSRNTYKNTKVERELPRRYFWAAATEDKLWLAHQLGVVNPDDPTSLVRLYNAASRLHLTGKTADARQQEAEAYAADMVRLRERDSASKLARFWDDYRDGYLRRVWGRYQPQWIAVYLGCTQIAVLRRARQLGLRRTPWSIELDKAAAWLGLDEQGLYALEAAGELVVHRHGDITGRVLNASVNTRSLAAWLASPENRARVLAAGADPLFVAELDEAMTESGCEDCPFLSIGRLCLSPRAASYEHSYTADHHCDGNDPDCSLRFPSGRPEPAPADALETFDPVAHRRATDFSIAAITP